MKICLALSDQLDQLRSLAAKHQTDSVLSVLFLVTNPVT
jgi:hypothetical protein